MERRDFLKLAALSAATAAASRRALAQVPSQGATPPALDPTVAARTGSDVAWNKAPCRFCGTGCTVQVGVRNGRIVSIAGDRLAPVNRGLLCVKGYHVGLALYGSDRLTQPMLKRNGRHEPITWPEAIDIIARRIAANPAGFAMYGSGQWTIPEGYAAQKLIKAGICNNQIDPNARLCMSSAVTGYVSTFGVDEPYNCFDDLDHADAVILWGNNMAEMHPVLFSRLIDRRTRGERVTLIDLTTRRTRTSAFADHVMLFKPQGDMAIANGIANGLFARGAVDRATVERFFNFRKDKATPDLEGQPMSFDEYRQSVARYTPERVQEWPAALFRSMTLGMVGFPVPQGRMTLFANPPYRVFFWITGSDRRRNRFRPSAWFPRQAVP